MHLSLFIAALVLAPDTRTIALAFTRAVVDGRYSDAAHMLDCPDDPAGRVSTYKVVMVEIQELARAFVPRGAGASGQAPSREETGLKVSATSGWDKRDQTGERNEFVSTNSAHGPCHFVFEFSPRGKLVVVTISVPKDDALQARFQQALVSALQRDAGVKLTH